MQNMYLFILAVLYILKHIVLFGQWTWYCVKNAFSSQQVVLGAHPMHSNEVFLPFAALGVVVLEVKYPPYHTLVDDSCLKDIGRWEPTYFRMATLFKLYLNSYWSQFTTFMKWIGYICKICLCGQQNKILPPKPWSMEALNISEVNTLSIWICISKERRVNSIPLWQLV